MAERVRRVLVIAGLAVGSAAAMPARAAEPVPAKASAAHAPSAPANASAAAADLELLEFLGSDDVEPEFQDYLANRAPAKAPASGRSEKK